MCQDCSDDEIEACSGHAFCQVTREPAGEARAIMRAWQANAKQNRT